MGTDRKLPQSAEELLERYASGERDFRQANLSGAFLRNAALNDVILTDANLDGADLSGAQFADSQLTFSHFRGANLRGAMLNNADMRATIFHDAVLSESSAAFCDLRESELNRANIISANLEEASLNDADLSGADVRGTQLSGVDFSDAKLSGANFAEAKLHATNLVGVDLAPLCIANPSVIHVEPSSVDYRSIVLSLQSPKLKEFLQRTGMPEVFVEYMIDCARTLDPKGIFKMLQSTFISYGGPDTAFAQQLNDALLKNGVTTFFFAKDAIPGKKLHRLMRDGVNQHDRVILVCSKASLDRPGVLNEITETLQRESRDGGKEYLIPITLDDYVFSGWKPEDPGLAQAIKDRVVANFRGAETDPVKFN